MRPSGHGFNSAAAGGREDRFEQRDVVDEMLGGDRVMFDPANGPGEGYEVVLDRFRRGDLYCRDRVASLCGCDYPAVGRLDMRLVANVDPAFRAKDRETREKGFASEADT